jgi:hypothetical protein
MIRVLSAAVLLSCSGQQTSASAEAVDLRHLHDEAVTRVQEYLRGNTVNPPGNETRGVEYLARLLAAEGIVHERSRMASAMWVRRR